MEIRSNLNVGKAEAASVEKPVSRPVAAASEDTAVFQAAVQVRQTLREVPDVRPEIVERARRLVGDPGYPPRETLQKIATLLAIRDGGRPS
jgi:hypothetical protein